MNTIEANGRNTHARMNRRRRTLVVAVVAVAYAMLLPHAASASCVGCFAKWGLHSNSADDVTGRRGNLAGEVITSQDFHGALIDDSAGNCSYEGTQKKTLNKAYNNVSNTPYWGTSMTASGPNDWWLWAGGHHWFDDGTNYNVWVADTCQKSENMAAA